MTTEVEIKEAKTEALKVSQPLLKEAATLVVCDEKTFQRADWIRGQIREAQKAVKSRLELIIRPAYLALQGLYDLQKELIGPMGSADVIITQKMQDYKRAELAKLREIEEEKRREEERLETLRREAETKTQTVKERSLEGFKAKRELASVAAQLVQAGAVAVPVAVKAANSNTRAVMKWKVNNLKELLAAIVIGDVPEDVIQVNEVCFNAYFRSDDANKTCIRGWAGITVYEDVEIVSKRQSKPTGP